MSHITKITDFDGSRRALGQMARVEDTRAAAEAFRRRMLAGPKAKYYESFDLVRVPYPSRYGLRNAFPRERVVEYLHLQNRLFVVQFDTSEGLKTLLMSPSDYERNAATPYFHRLEQTMPELVQRAFVFRQDTVPEIIARIGLAPEDIDYISYDHLHTQDVRRWLGSKYQPGVFPNAKLLVHEREWASALDLNPYQADWYCPNGIADIPEERIVRFEGSIMLGDGVALIHHPTAHREAETAKAHRG